MNTELCLKIKSKKEVRNTINKVSAYKVRQPLGIKCNIIIFCEYMDFNVWLIFLCHHFSLPQMIWNTESQNVKFQWGTQFTSCNIFQTEKKNNHCPISFYHSIFYVYSLIVEAFNKQEENFIGLAKMFGVFHRLLQKNLNKILANPI